MVPAGVVQVAVRDHNGLAGGLQDADGGLEGGVGAVDDHAQPIALGHASRPKAVSPPCTGSSVCTSPMSSGPPEETPASGRGGVRRPAERGRVLSAWSTLLVNLCS